MTAHPPHPHPHGPVRLDQADWEALVGQAEEEGELLLAFVTDTASWLAEVRGPDAPPARRVLDIGCGPGVGTCELARLFPDAQVIAVDASPAMLDRTARRAAELGLDGRITTHLAELPDGLADVEPADVIWASMSLHHIGDEIGALGVLRERLAPSGLLAVAEMAEPMQVVPDELDVGRPGLSDRLARAGTDWFAAMRAGLPSSVPSTDLPSMLGAAGFDVVGSRRARRRFDPPLSDAARKVAARQLRHGGQRLHDLLDEDDLRTLAALADADDPRSVLRRDDAFVAASRQIVVARARPRP